MEKMRCGLCRIFRNVFLNINLRLSKKDRKKKVFWSRTVAKHNIMKQKMGWKQYVDGRAPYIFECDGARVFRCGKSTACLHQFIQRILLVYRNKDISTKAILRKSERKLTTVIGCQLDDKEGLEGWRRKYGCDAGKPKEIGIITSIHRLLHVNW